MKTKTIIEDGKKYEVEIYYDGRVDWFLNGKFHREKGPAYYYERDGYKAWYQNNYAHRLDGPAAVWEDGIKHWRINDEYFTEQTHTKIRTMLALQLDKI
jgi:hypothetical protein